MSKKIFAIKALVFVLLLLGVDQLCGWGFRKLNSLSGDKFAREEYIRHTMQEELLIFGSSRAAQHYVASVIADSLGVRGYNCGQPGNGIIHAYGRLQTIQTRYTPKYIIVDLYGEYDLEKGDNTRFLDFLKPDYGQNDSVDAIFREIDPLSPLKMQLQSYRYNSTICDLLLNIVYQNRGRYRADGYFPLYGRMTAWPQTEATEKDPTEADPLPAKDREYDPVKLKYLHKLMAEVPEGCQLILVISPCAETFNPSHLKAYRRIADEHGIRLLDYSRSEAFRERPELFRNPYHLNEEGATLFSTILGSDLKQILQ